MTPEDVWRAKSNEDLVAASHRLSDYTEVGQRVIAAELHRRREAGMMSEAVSCDDELGGEDSTNAPEGVTPVPHGYVRRLWHGDIPLFITYWVWGVLANVVCVIVLASTAAAKMLLLMLILASLNLVYAVFAAIAIWRSAGRYPGRRIWAELARISVAASIANAVVNMIFRG